MIVVKIELWPHGREQYATELGRAYIANDGTAHGDRGNYNVAICRKNTTDVPREIYPPKVLEHPNYKDKPHASRAGRVTDYPRESYPIWRLVVQALLSAWPEEARPPASRTKNKHAPVFSSLVARGFELLADPLRHTLTKASLPPGEIGDALRAALEWLDASKKPALAE